MELTGVTSEQLISVSLLVQMMPKELHRIIASILDRENYFLNIRIRNSGQKLNSWFDYVQSFFDSTTSDSDYLRFRAHFHDNL